MITFYLIGVAITLVILIIDIILNRFSGWWNRTQNAKIFDIILAFIVCASSWFAILVIIILFIKEKTKKNS